VTDYTARIRVEICKSKTRIVMKTLRLEGLSIQAVSRFQKFKWFDCLSEGLS